MLKITDAERSTVVEIPIQLAESIGVFQDMVETAQGSGTGIVQAARLLDLPSPRVPSNGRQYGRFIGNVTKVRDTVIGKGRFLSSPHPNSIDFTGAAYFLGAAYGAPILETMYRPYVVSNFATLLTGPDSDPTAESHFNLLNRRYPEKVFGLVKDAVLAAEERVSQRDSALQDCKAAIFSIQRGRDNVLSVNESFLKRAKGKIAEIEEEIKKQQIFY